MRNPNSHDKTHGRARSGASALSPYLDRLLESYADELNESSRKRKAFFVFLFGGISGLAVERGLTPEQAQAVAVSLFYEELGDPADGRPASGRIWRGSNRRRNALVLRGASGRG